MIIYTTWPFFKHSLMVNEGSPDPGGIPGRWALKSVIIIGFALLILPVGLGVTAVVMLFNAALWAPAVARTLDQSLRYTVDKTSREILFLPLPHDLKLRAKPFVDVTMDRVAKAVGAILLLVLVQPWGLALDWQQLSFASLTLMVLWIVMAQRARKGYLEAFRTSLERGDVKAAEVRLSTADLSTVEALVEELAHPDAARTLYAIDLLESLDKRHLVTPLLLHHDAPMVRVRALSALSAQRPEIVERWAPAIRRLLRDDSPAVRAATTKIPISATWAPRTRILENASWPGVSIRLSVCPFHGMVAGCSLMVIPRSRSKSIVSRTWFRISRAVRVPVASMRRSANVDFPWSIWATMQKFLINLDSSIKRMYDLARESYVFNR